MRHRVSPGKDHRMFKRTAVRSKKINLYPSPMRGGIRL